MSPEAEGRRRADAGAMTNTDLQTTLREMWETRPARPSDDRQVAGVALAVARRYDIDPVLVRVGFVVAGFAGIGALLYIAGWVALPDGARAGTRPTGRLLPTIALVVATVFGIGSVLEFRVSTLLAGVVAVGLLVLLHRNRAHLGIATPGGPVPATAGPTPEAPARRPPAWDPLGVAPYAWDLPEPPPPPVPPPGPRVTALTLAAALLAGGVTGLVLLLTGGGAGILFGVLLAVLGGGLAAGAFLHAGRGLIPVALVTGAIAWAVVASPFDDWDGQVADQRFAPATAAAVLPVYEARVGTFELDLRGLDLTATTGTAPTPVRTVVHAEGGDVAVLVPPDADVSVRGTVDIGRIAFGDAEQAGPNSRLDVVDDLGADGVRSDRPIVLDLTADVGNVEVRRG